MPQLRGDVYTGVGTLYCAVPSKQKYYSLDLDYFTVTSETSRGTTWITFFKRQLRKSKPWKMHIFSFTSGAALHHIVINEICTNVSMCRKKLGINYITFGMRLKDAGEDT